MFHVEHSRFNVSHGTIGVFIMCPRCEVLQQGKVAYYAGLKLENNPFKIGSEGFSTWEEGWRSGEDDTISISNEREMRRLTNYLHLHQIKLINNQRRTEESIKELLCFFPFRRKKIIEKVQKLLQETISRGREVDRYKIYEDENIQSLIDKELMKGR